MVFFPFYSQCWCVIFSFISSRTGHQDMDIPEIPGCVCGRRGGGEVGSLSGSIGMAPWMDTNGTTTPSSVSTSLLTKNKPFPIRGWSCVRLNSSFTMFCETSILPWLALPSLPCPQLHSSFLKPMCTYAPKFLYPPICGIREDRQTDSVVWKLLLICIISL